MPARLMPARAVPAAQVTAVLDAGARYLWDKLDCENVEIEGQLARMISIGSAREAAASWAETGEQRDDDDHRFGEDERQEGRRRSNSRGRRSRIRVTSPAAVQPGPRARRAPRDQGRRGAR